MHTTTEGPGAGARRRSRWLQRLSWPALALLAGCVATQFEAATVIPEPLVTRIPVVVGVHVPAAFSEAVHREKREGAEVVIALGKAQTAGFLRLMNAMFTRAVPVPTAEAGATTDAQIRGVLEPVLEEFSFVTPRDTGTPLYAVSLKYRINAYTPAGRLVDSWTFTGYGSQSSSSMPGQGKTALQEAASIAMRDAGTKIAVEFREQAIVRGLLEPAPATAPATTPPEQAERAETEAQPPP